MLIFKVNNSCRNSEEGSNRFHYEMYRYSNIQLSYFYNHNLIHISKEVGTLCKQKQKKNAIIGKAPKHRFYLFISIFRMDHSKNKCFEILSFLYIKVILNVMDITTWASTNQSVNTIHCGFHKPWLKFKQRRIHM